MNYIHSVNSSKAGRGHYRHPSCSSAIQKLWPFASRWLGLTLATGSFLFAEPLPAATPLAWGEGKFGQLGDDNFYTSPPYGAATAVQVSGLSTVTAIAGGGSHSLALNSDGTVWAWGYDSNGQLGDGNFYPNSPFGVATPVQVSGLTSVTAIAGGGFHSLALKSDGTVWAWGYGSKGQLGDGNFYSNSPLYGVATPVQVLGLTTATAIAGGTFHSLALKSDGTVWAWGWGLYGQLGDGNFYTTGNQGVATPVQVSGLSGVVAIAAGNNHSLALKSDGTVWAWGNGEDGELGDGIFYPDPRVAGNGGAAAPVQVSALTTVTSIAGGGQHNLALKSDGTVWAWGQGTSGQLGDGNFYSTGNDGVATPVQVSGLSGVVAIAGGGHHSLALKPDGTVWAWGMGDEGEIGDGNFYPSGVATPVQVSSLAQLARAIAAGSVHCLALPSTPTLTIDQPLEGASFAGPIDVTIEATISDSAGVVTQVDFYNNTCNNNILLASVTAPPYRFTMNSLTSGSYSIFVRAIGGGFPSSVVHFSVVGGPIQNLVNAAASGSTVDIPAGVYLDTVIINKNLTLQGAGVGSTTIDGSNGCVPTVFVTGGATVTLSGLTVTRGGIVNDSTLTVNDCAITANDTLSGIHNLVSGTVFMNNCTVSGNRIGSDGGGLFNEGTMILSQCTIRGNVVLNHICCTAGGIKNLGSLTLSNSAIIQNGSEFGVGGILNDGTLVLNNCRASSNGGGDVGGIANSGQATINSCTIDGNEGGGPDGGGGGGLSNGGVLTLNNCTVSNNEIDESNGGGISNAGTLNLNHCTISGNSALGIFFLNIKGGGVMNYAGTVNCQNTIIADNFATRPPGATIAAGPDFFGTLTSQGYNLIGTTQDTVIVGITTGNLLNIDPLLGPLQDNGGPTPTRALLPSSPAIDAGTSGGLKTDQRGVPRPIDIPSLANVADGSDIGAYEFNASAPTVTITCPADIAADTDPGGYAAVVNYPAPVVSGGAADLVLVCNPPSGVVFPLGTTTVVCTATDASGNIIAACSFTVTVSDRQPPDVSYVVVKTPTLRQNPPRIGGWFQLLASDNFDLDPLIYIKGSAGSFVAGPFHRGDQVEVSHGPTLIPRQIPSTAGGNIASIQVNGDALVWAVDSFGNASTPIKLK